MIAIAGLVLIFPAALAAAAPITIAVVVAASDHGDELSVSEIAAIYRRKIRIDSRGQTLAPVNLPGSDLLRIAFSRALFNQEPESLQDYWNEQYFHGISPPYVLASEEAVIRFVSTTAGAIGYVRSCIVDKRVHSIAHLTIPAGARFDILRRCGSAIQPLPEHSDPR